MKTIAVYFSDKAPMGYPFDKPEYLEIYTWFVKALKEKDVQLVFARGDSYEGDGLFALVWEMQEDGSLIDQKNVSVDLIWNRDDKNTIPYITDCPIINHPAFDELCVDKIMTANKFPECSPRSASTHTFEQMSNTLHSWHLEPEDFVVLKKNFETEGRGIFIGPYKDVEEALYDDWGDILVQEFLDSSEGIPGIVEGLHDLRVTVVDHKPVNAFIRTPKKGSFLANIGQGGSGTSLALEKVPQEVLDLVAQIDQKLDRYSPCLYSADFMNSQIGFKLVELNSRPGVQHKNWSDTYLDFNRAVVDMLVKAVS